MHPGRGTQQYMTWHIGASDNPPAPAMQAFGEDVLINQIKVLNATPTTQKHITPFRTKQHLQQSKALSSNNDPWQTEADPWAAFKANQQRRLHANYHVLDLRVPQKPYLAQRTRTN